MPGSAIIWPGAGTEPASAESHQQLVTGPLGARNEGVRVYIDEGGDENGDIKVTVDHQDYEVEANYDSHHDGVDDTAMVQTDHGYVGFTDTHHSGHADLMTTFDDDGHVTGQASYDAASGEWVSTGDHGDAPDPSEQTSTQTGHDIRVDTPSGEQDVGPATESSAGDDHPDTAVVRTDDGGMILYTDKDGDGEADQSTEIDAHGHVTIKVHEGHGEWKTVQTGHLDGNGEYVPDGHNSAAGDGNTTDGLLLGWGSGAAAGGVHIDPDTGEWVG